jgi:hypothetical protein
LFLPSKKNHIFISLAEKYTKQNVQECAAYGSQGQRRTNFERKNPYLEVPTISEFCIDMDRDDFYEFSKCCSKIYALYFGQKKSW